VVISDGLSSYAIATNLLLVRIEYSGVMQFRLSLPLLLIIAVIFLTTTSVSPFILSAFGQKSTASDVYETKSLKLSPNIKHLVILIPNEGHESQNPGDVSSDQRLINQPYIPQRATVNPGTAVIWFNGDVDHDHKITLTDGANPENTIFDSDTFAYNEPSKPIVLNDTGTINYYETDVNNEDQDYVMNGTIDVVSQQGPNANNIVTGVQGNADTAGVLMVPAEELDTYVQDLKSNGFAVDSTEDFSDIRAGDQQVLLVWTTSGIDLGQVISTLQRITPNLPYS
jgi:plastocyanin